MSVDGGGLLKGSIPMAIPTAQDATAAAVTSKVLWHILNQELRHACVVARSMSDAVVGLTGILCHATKGPLASLHFIIASDATDTCAFREEATRLASQGCKFRVLDGIETDIAVVDRSLSISLTPPRIISDVKEVRCSAALVDAMWSRARPLEWGETISLPVALTPRATQVLQLLAEGMTDESVARRLGVSVRTVRNDVAATMGRVDTTSRFQMGARAARLGLV